MQHINQQQAGLFATVSAFGFIALWLERISRSTFDQMLVISTTNLMVDISLFISAVTNPTTVLTVVILSGIFATYEHHAKIWWLASGLLLLATAVSTLLKQLVALPRPDAALIQLSSFGFPSTHATLATVLFICGVWFYTWLKGRPQIYAALLGGAAWLVICASRLLLGVHSVSDVLSGILLGTAIAVVAASLAPRLFEYLKIKRSNFA